METQRTFYAAVIAACLNGLSVGNLAGWPQAAIPQLLQGTTTGGPIFTESEVSWIAGIFFLGMLGGGFASVAVAERFGKVKLFLLATLPLTLGWTLVAFANTFWTFVIARIILGTGGGMLCHQTEMYLSEVSPPKKRSGMSVLFCASIHLGVLLSFGIGPSLSISSATRIYIGIVLILMVLYSSAVPETPFWLIRQGQHDEAFEILRKLRGKNNVNEEFQGIIEFVQRCDYTKTTTDHGPWTSFKNVLESSSKRRAVLLVVLLTTAQQFSGMAAMHSYAQLIFERTTSLIPGRYVSLLIGSIELCCTLGSGFLVERIGRRTLVGSGTVICSICMGLMGLSFHKSFFTVDKDYDSLPIICVVVFALAYGLCLSTMATVVAAECLSMDARNIGAAAQNTTVCFSIFFITKLWQVIATTFGQEYSFWLASALTAFHALLLLYVLPETRGKSLVEIQALLVVSPLDKRSPKAIAPLLPVFQSISIVPAKRHIVKDDKLRLPQTFVT